MSDEYEFLVDPSATAEHLVCHRNGGTTYFLKQLFANADLSSEEARKMIRKEVIVRFVWTPVRSDALALPKDRAFEIISESNDTNTKTYAVVAK